MLSRARRTTTGGWVVRLITAWTTPPTWTRFPPSSRAKVFRCHASGLLQPCGLQASALSTRLFLPTKFQRPLDLVIRHESLQLVEFPVLHLADLLLVGVGLESHLQSRGDGVLTLIEPPKEQVELLRGERAIIFVRPKQVLQRLGELRVLLGEVLNRVHNGSPLGTCERLTPVPLQHRCCVPPSDDSPCLRVGHLDSELFDALRTNLERVAGESVPDLKQVAELLVVKKLADLGRLISPLHVAGVRPLLERDVHVLLLTTEWLDVLPHALQVPIHHLPSLLQMVAGIRSPVSAVRVPLPRNYHQPRRVGSLVK
ncbi:hypothetical protein ACN28S_11425 [Cystobacter fuscus]